MTAAIYVMRRIPASFRECKLEIHPNKSKIVYCKEWNCLKDGLAYRSRSIFKRIPQKKRIFLFVRPTNKVALEMYQALEFVADIDL